MWLFTVFSTSSNNAQIRFDNFLFSFQIFQDLILVHPTEDRVVLGYGDTRHQSGALGSREGGHGYS